MYVTESDVEQKFIYPLLTTAAPEGLGFTASEVKTKASIRRLSVDKGANRKLYFPDYAVVIDGVPALIIEAKSPAEDVDEAFREARLYAAEVNAQYASGLNPCARVIATNGVRLVGGYWDQSSYEIDLSVDQFSPVSAEYAALEAFASRTAVNDAVKEVLKTARKSAEYFKPTSLLGGRTVTDETVGDNSFGSNISIEYKYLFNPEGSADRERIVKNAYVTSRRRLAHVAPIDKIIRAAVPPHIRDAREVGDLSAPVEITEQIEKINNRKDSSQNELCLLIGSVGSGKSTFTDYLRIEALSPDLERSTLWVSVNLNIAPLSRDAIYDWLLEQLIAVIREKFPKDDHEDLSFLKTLYAGPLGRVARGRAALFPPDSDTFKAILFEELKRLEGDKIATAKAYIEYYAKSRGRLLVVVLDNCDKRGRDDQLLMFEVASWLKNTLACTVFLPLRDTTYDQYRGEPPLDTVIKDLVFRIDPPLLEKVIHARLKYALREIAADTKGFVYYLSNGIRVDCKREDVGDYLKSIVASLFQDGFFRRIVTGLAGRNIRRGLEIVLDFCKSGHISESDILKIRTTGGEHKVPNHIVSRILLKGNRVRYSDKTATIRNLFDSSIEDDLPNPFVRIAILQWLRVRKSEYGPNRTKGFHQLASLMNDLEEAGFASARVMTEIQVLSEAECIVSESNTSLLTEQDLITIAPAGYIHLDLVADVNYLSSVAEDVYFDSRAKAKAVADNLVGRGIFPVESRQAALSNASLLLEFLKGYSESYLLGDVKLLAANSVGYGEAIAEAADKVERLKDNDRRYRDSEALARMYPPGSEEAGQVVSVQHYGFFVDFGAQGHGLVHKTRFNGLVAGNNDIETGDWVLVKIVGYDATKSRFDLMLIDR